MFSGQISLLKKTARLAIASSLLFCISTQMNSFAQEQTTAPKQSENLTAILDQLKAQRVTLKDNPDDPKAHFRLAELLKKCGRDKEAAQEYMAAADLDPNLYISYHQMSQLNIEPSQLDVPVERLKLQMDKKPKELMLRVALSELLEKQNEYYRAARVLIDMIYAGTVPPKYVKQVNARIHFLLGRSKTVQAKGQPIVEEQDLNLVPAPIPEMSLHNKIINKGTSREAKQIKGIGNIPLLD